MNRRGFTIIELLIVIMIVTILAALLMPTLQESLRMARIVSCMSQHKQHYVNCMAFVDDHGNRLPEPPFNDGYQTMNYLSNSHSSYTESPTHTRYGWGGHLLSQGYGNDKWVYLCPGTKYTTGLYHVDAMYKNMRTLTVEEWMEKSKGVWGSYSLSRYGRFKKVFMQKQLMFVEAVGAFGYPKADWIEEMHGAWPANHKEYNAAHTCNLGAMNVTISDGQVRTLEAWGNEFKWPCWNIRDYYWPYNDRRSWGFWKNFNLELTGEFVE